MAYTNFIMLLFTTPEPPEIDDKKGKKRREEPVFEATEMDARQFFKNFDV